MSKKGQGSRVKGQGILIVLSAILLILSFPNFNLEFLAWIGLVPLLLAIENKKPLQAFLLSYATGILFFFGTIWWLIHVTLPGMIAVVFWQALYFGAFGLAANYSLRFTLHASRITNLIALFFIPALWVALEWIRSSGMFGFGWVLLGYSQSFTLPVIQIADMAGVYGVSFLVVMVNAALYMAIRAFAKKEDSKPYIVLAALFLFLTLIYGYMRLNNIFTGQQLNVAVVQGNIPQKEKWDANFRERIIQTYERLTTEAVKDKPEIVIWPETSVPGFLEAEDDLMDRVRSLVLASRVPFLVGAPRMDPRSQDVYYNSTYLLSEDGRITAHYDKMHLVPFGEFIPFKRLLYFVEKFAPMPIGDFSKGKDYTVFSFPIRRDTRSENATWKLWKRVRFSTLICFEDIFPDLTRRFVKEGIDFLVNMTNDAWFHKTSAAYQHAQCSVFRAVENRIAVIRAANTGLSCFIDQKGMIVSTVKEGGEELFVGGFKSHAITLARTRTLYCVYGDIFAYFCIAFSCAYIIVLFQFRKR